MAKFDPLQFGCFFVTINTDFSFMFHVFCILKGILFKDRDRSAAPGIILDYKKRIYFRRSEVAKFGLVWRSLVVEKQ